MAHGLQSWARCWAVGNGFSPKLHAYVQGSAQPCPPWCHRQPALQMGIWALPVGRLWNSRGHNWLWLPRDVGGHNLKLEAPRGPGPSLDLSGGWTS